MYYKAYITHPDFPDTRQIWIKPSIEELAAYQEFVTKEREAFTTLYSNNEDADSLWHDWLSDAFVDADFQIELPNAINPIPAHVDYIDLETPISSIPYLSNQ